MGHTLIAAHEKQGYVLADRGTYLAMKPKLDLEVVFEGDDALFNPYGIIAVNPARYPHANYVMAMAAYNDLVRVTVEAGVSWTVLVNPDSVSALDLKLGSPRHCS